jgi:hypothetical protein
LVGGLAALAVVASAVAGRRLGEPRAAIRRWILATAILLVVWLGVSYGLGRTSWLADFGARPPHLLRALLITTAATFALAFSRFGGRLARGLPVAGLVGYQLFRLPVELLLAWGRADGFVPVQMTFSGRNFDVVTALTAVVIAALAARGRAPRWLVLAWNLGGLLLLGNVVVIAALSMPGALRLFYNEPANTWVAHAPFTWLPFFVVQVALFGHLVLFRKLAARG